MTITWVWFARTVLVAIGLAWLAALAVALGSNPGREPAAYHGSMKVGADVCDYEVTWSGRYRPAPPEPCSPAEIEYMEHWLPIILPDGRRLQPPKWKPGRTAPPFCCQGEDPSIQS